MRFLPSPYWGVENLRIDIGDVASISLAKKRGSGGRAAAYGSGLGFLISGALLAAASKYDSDYQLSLIAALSAGAVAGLIALAVSASSRAGRSRRYDLTQMTDPQKAKVIMTIMLTGK